MPGTGVNPIQTWLWSQLDSLGIDGVIYSRHILDLLTSSNHTFDCRMDEKEQSIFSKVAPNSKKRKQKYSRRSRSFSACEEILCKKEIAVACLLSAAESKENAVDTEATIQQVVNELYDKLAGLNLTSDSLYASFDGNSPATDFNRNDVHTKRQHKKENYEDAFPSLYGSSRSSVPSSMSNSVWNKVEKKNELRPRCDSDNAPLSKSCYSATMNQQKPFRRISSGRTPRKEMSQPSVIKSDDESGSRCNSTARKFYPCCAYPRHPKRRLFTPKKCRSASAGSHCTSRPRYSGSPAAKRPLHSRCPGRHSTKIDRSDKLKKKADTLSSQKRRVGNTAKAADMISGVQQRFTQKENSSQMPTHSKKNSNSLEQQLDYAHLPSWMETNLVSISQNPDILHMYETHEVEQLSGSNFAAEDGVKKGMPFSNRWFRDPESGLLTFRPLKSSHDCDSSSSQSAISRQSYSEFEEEDDELFRDEQPTAQIPAVAESWMWCPSPSLWEDGQQSPVSRLESVYKKELLSIGTENHADNISGRIWEEYKTIFLDLQDMDSGSEQDSSEGERSGSVWSSKDDGEASSFPQTTPKRSTEDLSAPNFCIGKEFSESAKSFDLWSETTPITSIARNSSFDNIAVTTLKNEISSYNIGCGGSNIWKYTSESGAWSIEDDINPKHQQQFNGELASLMENGAFGYHCHARKGEGSAKLQKESMVRGAGVMPRIETQDSPKETHDETVMHSLVDALVGDLGFDLCFGADNLHMPPYSPMSSLNHDFQTTLSFDFRSIFLQTPIKNLHSPNDNPWQPRWDIDDLFSDARASHLPPLMKIDDLFMSLAAAEELDHQYGRLGETPKRTTFLDSITENEAWKTSLRIGNTWQTISGIRPVNVIYSENKPGPQPDEKLIPSSDTHFRPISTSVGTVTPNFDHAMAMDCPYSPESNCIGIGQDEIQTIISDSDGPYNEIRDPMLLEDPDFQMNFCKLVHDKSMQTSFEMTVQQDIPSCQQFVLPRPPKANSR